MGPLADESCIDCGGSGWAVDDAGRARACACRLRAIAAAKSRIVGVPARYQGLTLDGFRLAGARDSAALLLGDAKARAQRYVDEFIGEDGATATRGLIFVGPPGCGKTHLAAAVLQACQARAGLWAQFLDFGKFLDDLKATFDPESEEQTDAVMRAPMNCDLLHLDELGAQKATAWSLDRLQQLVNQRYSERRPTLFTSNFSMDEPGPTLRLEQSLHSRIPAPLISRIWEMADVVPMAGWDYRKDVARFSPDAR